MEKKLREQYSDIVDSKFVWTAVEERRKSSSI